MLPEFTFPTVMYGIEILLCAFMCALTLMQAFRPRIPQNPAPPEGFAGSGWFCRASLHIQCHFNYLLRGMSTPMALDIVERRLKTRGPEGV